jgi:hypothetical protein
VKRAISLTLRSPPSTLSLQGHLVDLQKSHADLFDPIQLLRAGRRDVQHKLGVFSINSTFSLSTASMLANVVFVVLNVCPRCKETL